ncbi:hypothetical protein O5O45_05575 [Hahella aquimaris]|uniref:hypothetical protein n=1 Tax=Hahella sp. HNIBRBA332 TaxID=3015983 RepID=UPI00273BAF54|nr:hypothetical protein [Hahella sp. HNIBRBA332]WLQ15389.1 hypothetical protein O5O45_05575 [Hahella sp. HNIBRBA332]
MKYMNYLERQEIKERILESTAKSIAEDLLEGRRVHVNGQKWGFQDVLDEVKQGDDIDSVLSLLYQSRDDKKGRQTAVTSCKQMIDNAAYSIGKYLADAAYKQEQEDIAIDRYETNQHYHSIQ